LLLKELFGQMNKISVLKEKLSLLVIDKEKDLSAKEVIRISQKLDKLILLQMKEKNGLNKQLSLFREYI